MLKQFTFQKVWKILLLLIFLKIVLNERTKKGICFLKFWFCIGSPLPPPPPPPRISPDSSSGSGSVIGANHNKYSSRKTKSNSKYHHTSNNNVVTFKAHINNGGSVTSSSLILHPGTSRTRQKKIKKRKKGMYHNLHLKNHSIYVFSAKKVQCKAKI